MRIVYAVFAWAVVCVAHADAGFDFRITTYDAVGTTLQSTFCLGDTVTVRVSAVDNRGAPGPNVSSGDVIGGGWTIVADTSDVDDYFGWATSGFSDLFNMRGVPSNSGATFAFVGTPSATSPVDLGLFQFVVNVLGDTNISFDAAANNGVLFGPAASSTYVAAASLGGATVTAVPEPSSLGLLCLGCAALAFRRKR
ncbi:MAG: PEP-CTERM sorting domain-containing protein [Planctomycetales bacterium]|nr:PEP-CTERM sorting domain-containing protein [Planctomycetales bacterium]